MSTTSVGALTSPTQTYSTSEPGRHRADRRAEGGRLRGQPARHRQRLHGARARHGGQDAVRCPVGDAPPRAATTRPCSATSARTSARCCWRAWSARTTCRSTRTTSGSQLFREINDEYNDGAPFTGNTIFGMSVGYPFAEALAKAGEDPTRESLVEALEGGQLKGNGIVPLDLRQGPPRAPSAGSASRWSTRASRPTWTARRSPRTPPTARSSRTRGRRWRWRPRGFPPPDPAQKGPAPAFPGPALSLAAVQEELGRRVLDHQLALEHLAAGPERQGLVTGAPPAGTCRPRSWSCMNVHDLLRRSGLAGLRATTAACTSWPCVSSATPNTAAGATAGCAQHRLLDLARVHVVAVADDHVLLAVDDRDARRRRPWCPGRRCGTSRPRRPQAVASGLPR